MKKRFTLLFLLCLFLQGMHLHAQVTIGSNIAPVHGALLQLKENESKDDNTTRGLVMPRVKLTSLSPVDDNLATTIHGAALSPVWDKAAHVGLTVYNVNRCAPFGKGLYVWNGANWESVNAASPLLPPSLSIGTATLNLPSGMDARGTTTTGVLTFYWAANGTAGWSSPFTFDSGKGLLFGGSTTPNAQVLPTAKIWTVSPAILSVQPDAMTSALVTAATPWQTRESKTTISVPANECGEAASIPLILNQTNFAILSYNNGKGAAGATNILTTASTFIRLTDAILKTFRIKSNAAWQTTIDDPHNIMTQTIAATGGSDITNGTIPPDNDYTLTGIAGTGTKYQTATITIQDSHSDKRAQDVTVTCYSCLGTDASLAGLRTADPLETSAASNTWGTAVILHEAKAGFYEQFTSADFGAAGRWMTTNLSAKAYDGITHSQSRQLTGPNGNSGSAYNAAYWCYPSATIPTTVTQYNANKSLGFLYTWDAATAGKGGPSGQIGVNEAGQNHATPQGICPAGWHLPSDYEWTQLENAIIQKTSQYSFLSDINPSDANTLPQNGSTSWSGTAHGAAMKEVCETLPSFDPAGASKPASQGGFSAPLPGIASGGKSLNFGNTGYFWSSSSSSSGYAWGRYLERSEGRVYHSGFFRHYLFSVRCKKD